MSECMLVYVSDFDCIAFRKKDNDAIHLVHLLFPSGETSF